MTPEDQKAIAVITELARYYGFTVKADDITLLRNRYETSRNRNRVKRRRDRTVDKGVEN